MAGVVSIRSLILLQTCEIERIASKSASATGGQFARRPPLTVLRREIWRQGSERRILTSSSVGRSIILVSAIEILHSQGNSVLFNGMAVGLVLKPKTLLPCSHSVAMRVGLTEYEIQTPAFEDSEG